MRNRVQALHDAYWVFYIALGSKDEYPSADRGGRAADDPAAQPREGRHHRDTFCYGLRRIYSWW